MSEPRFNKGDRVQVTDTDYYGIISDIWVIDELDRDIVYAIVSFDKLDNEIVATARIEEQSWLTLVEDDG
ncbi:MAG: hypothetical protein KKB31_07945 [Nanoarchaeota archaeon]|nr:hypothetical protein [Nanoarchaeota archaeon]